MASKFMNNALGLTGPAGLASWCVAGAGAYYFFYLPEEKKRQDEIERAANAARLMRGKEYTEFVAKHEAKSAAEKGWYGGWFGGSKKQTRGVVRVGGKASGTRSGRSDEGEDARIPEASSSRRRARRDRARGEKKTRGSL